MIKPVAMQKLQVIGLQSDKEAMLSRLQGLGVLHIEDIAERAGEWEIERDHIPKYGMQATDLVARIEWIEDFFGYMREASKKGVIDLVMDWVRPVVERPVKVERIGTERLLNEAEAKVSSLERVCLRLDKKFNDITEKQNARTGKRTKIENLRVLGTKLSHLKDGPNTRVAVGLMPRGLDLGAQIPRPNYYYSRAYDEERQIIVAIVMLENGEGLDKLLRQNGFVPLPVDGEKTPVEELKAIKAELSELAKEADEVRQEARKLDRVHKRGMVVLKEQIQIEKSRADQYHSFVKTGSTFMLEGWVPRKDVEGVQQSLDNFGDRTVVNVSDPTPEEVEDVPSILENGWYVKPFELLLNMFGKPGYKAWDPTPIMALFYPLFFGIMLGDVGYGSLLLIISLILYYGKGKYEPGVRQFGFILLVSSIVTIVSGFMFGSFFGNLFPWFTPMWMDPVKDPMPLLMIALGLGLVHLNIGMIFGFMQNISNKAYRKAVGEQGGWMVLEIGFILLALKAMGFGDGVYLGGFFTLSGIALLVWMNGPQQLLGLSGFIGNWVSYARIMALGLATGSVAMAFNLLSGMGGDLPYVGVLLGPILLVFTQLLNFMMNVLGSFIHSLRLHFVEFFDKFYEGAGKDYKPFMITRIHTTI